MRKLRLDVENLVVESFEVADEDRERGTVVAHGPSNKPGCQQTYGCPISDDEPTCAISCGHIDTSCPYICA